jgi:ribulose-5-phosphate 4-epimerase/fuculose-1-phosphate aldolase
MKSARIHPFAKSMAELCEYLHQRGWTPGNNAQLSARDEDLLWFTPSDIGFRNLRPEHLVAVCPDGKFFGELTDDLTARIRWHQAWYQAQPTAHAILVAQPPHLRAVAQHQFNCHPQAQSFLIPGIDAEIALLPPQSETSRMEALRTIAFHASIAVEIAFGVIIASPALATAIDTLETLEVAATWLNTLQTIQPQPSN